MPQLWVWDYCRQENEDIKNIIPEPVVTPLPRAHQQPFDYDGEVYIGSPTEGRPEAEYPDEEEEEEQEEDNQLNPRGDVFSGCFFFHLNHLHFVASILGGP